MHALHCFALHHTCIRVPVPALGLATETCESIKIRIGAESQGCLLSLPMANVRSMTYVPTYIICIIEINISFDSIDKKEFMPRSHVLFA